MNTSQPVRRVRAEHAHSPSHRPGARVKIALALGVLLGAMLGHFATRQRASRASAACESHAEGASGTSSSPKSAAAPDQRAQTAREPARETCTSRLPDESHADGAKLAAELVDSILTRVSLAERALPDGNPEIAATMSAEYQRGLMDAILQAAPDLTDAIAQRVQQLLGRSDARTSHLVAMARLVHSVPELAGTAGFDCVFSKHAGKDVVLWSMLDAWQNSELPAGQALIALRKNTTDGRIRMRLAEQDELAARAAAFRNAMEDGLPPPVETLSPAGER